MTTPAPIVTLLTDFGLEGRYVPAMKGVILGIAPSAHIIDLSHQVPAQDILNAALLLEAVVPYYPAHTIHCVVIDPGVGSSRKAIGVQTEFGSFIAPDNGVLSLVLEHAAEMQAVVLENPAYHLPAASHTFHGRDIFSSAAAHLATGVSIGAFGPVFSDWVRIRRPAFTVADDTLRGEVLQVDHFGNVLTSIGPMRWVDEGAVEIALPDDTSLRFDARDVHVTFGWHRLSGLFHTYSEVETSHSLALISSSGELELAINQGNASKQFSIAPGDPVTMTITTT